MSHSVHPYAHRLGIIKDWKSRWFAVGSKYKKNLKRDITIREHLDKKLRGLHVGSVDIESSEKVVKVIIRTSRPGLIIGRSGEGVAKLREEIETILKKGKLVKEGQEIKLDIEEIRSPESNALIVAQMVAEGLEKRMPFRRILKQTVDKVIANRDVQGVRIKLSGRLGGADMARREELKKGRIPLQTLRADIDFARYEAALPYGNIGIKVWIYRGLVFDKKNSAK